MRPIYLDYNSTTQVDPKVLEAMMPHFMDHFGNAASKSHLMGWEAEDVVAEARVTIAKSFNAEGKSITFTSGSTEAINLAIKGFMGKSRKKHIVTVCTEHKAVLDTIASVCTNGDTTATLLPVNNIGQLNLNELESSITNQTAMVVIMFVNNETGLIHPVEEISKICRRKGVKFFCDSTQAVGKMKIDPNQLGIDMMACSAHKIYGPKGVGLLYIGNDIELEEQMSGGGHERGRRSGTLNVPGIIGFAKAISLANEDLDRVSRRIAILRDMLEEEILSQIEGCSVNGKTKSRIWNTTNIRFPGIDSEDLFLQIGRELAVSSGSACTSASVEPSHVLRAMGLAVDEAMGSLRFSLGKATTEQQIKKAIQIIVNAVAPK